MKLSIHVPIFVQIYLISVRERRTSSWRRNSWEPLLVLDEIHLIEWSGVISIAKFGKKNVPVGLIFCSFVETPSKLQCNMKYIEKRFYTFDFTHSLHFVLFYLTWKMGCHYSFCSPFNDGSIRLSLKFEQEIYLTKTYGWSNFSMR